MYLNLSFEAWKDTSKADFEWQNHLEWIAKNQIGRPMATDKYTVEELEKMGMVGIYASDTLNNS